MSFHNWLQAIRPKTLSAGAGPILVGTGFVIHAGVTPDGTTFVLTLICTLLLQIGANLANDYYDFVNKVDGPDRLGPLRMSSSGRIPPFRVRWAFILCLLAALLLGIFLVWQRGSPPTLLVAGLACVLLAWAYTGGPFPLSHWGLGEVTALIVFGPFAVWGSAVLQFGPESSRALPALYWGIGPGLIAAALMALNNLRDRHSDSAASKTTLATLLGEKGARLMVIIPILLAALSPLPGAWISEDPLIFLVALTPLPFIPTWKHICTGTVDPRLNQALAKIGLFLGFYSLVLALTLSL